MSKKIRHIRIGVPAEEAESWLLKLTRIVWQNDALFKFIEAHPEMTAEQIIYWFNKEHKSLRRKSAIIKYAHRWGLPINEEKKQPEE